jgi:CheY-like chemotaxis protein
LSDRPPPPPPPAAPPGRERRLRILFALLSAVATLLALEGGIRVYDLARGRSVRARASWYWLYEQDPHLGFRGRAGARLTTPGDVVRHDAEGFRDDRDLATVATGDRRLVICVGESSTYGISAGTNEDTYPARLEAGLRASSGDPRWVVFNAGMPGYTSYEVLNLIRLRLLRARPEAIVAMSLRNDHEFIARSLDDAQDYDFYPLRVAQLSASFPNECLMRSSLYSLLVTRMRARFIDDLGGRQPARTYSEPTPRGLKMYRDDIAETAALCARSGVRLFYVDQPVDVRAYDTAKKESLASFARRSWTRAARTASPSSPPTLDSTGQT